MNVLTLADRYARAAVVPELGAGLACYDWMADGDPVPLFRPCRDVPRANPFDLACNVLVPWSNRISDGFRYGGSFHPLEPNLPGEPCPIHGNGFQVPWAIAQRTASSVTLSLSSPGPPPFRYGASINYRLEDG